MSKLGKGIELKPAHFTNVRQRIHMIGIELEGGWEKLPKGVEVIRDGSVRFPIPINYVGELVSRPMELDEWRKWLKTYYPHHVNETCGMHVHMSFKNALTYSRLMNPNYPATVVRYMRVWAEREVSNGDMTSDHPIFPRLDGKSEYCQHVYQAEDQVFVSRKEYDHHARGHRYTVVGYPFARHSTVEVRLLPMMASWEQAERAINEILKITNAYLVATARRESKLVGTVEAESTGISEVQTLHVPTQVNRRVLRG